METIKFIQGSFTCEEAKEILLEVITKKINFHNLKNFSSIIRFEKPDEDSKRRLEELKEAKEKVLLLVEEAKRSNSSLVIESTINIMLEAREQPEAACSEAESY
ncbi:hypothetical protein [Pontibacter litorisediminis]|uniref:hypothetical protein n=1 Tax=Pontibacter litorisediminis TaxID=1846260 RepID=UPI0023ED1C72|nr:hypothetical protein [Pontibacter litorisediminis]